MINIFKPLNNLSTKNINLCSLIFIFILCITQYYLHDDSINRDGALYIYQALAISHGQTFFAKEMYENITYAKLIALTHQVLKIDIANAARLIGLFFFITTSYFFIKIINFFKADYRVTICAAIVIASSLILDKYLILIIRDHAQWAGVISSTYFMLMWIKNKKLYDFFISIFLIFLASFFRLEIIILIPFIFIYSLFIYKRVSNLKNIKNLFLLIFLVVAILILFFYKFENLLNFKKYESLLFLGFKNFITPLEIHSTNFWLSQLLKDYPILLKFCFFSGLSMYKFIKSFGIVYFALVFIFLKYEHWKKSEKYYYFYIFMIFIISFILPIINLFSVNVLSTRYFIPSFWILMLFSSLGLYYLFFELKDHQMKFIKTFKYVVIIFILIRFADVLFDKQSTSLDKQVAQWIIGNNIPSNSIYVDNLRIRYYLKNMTLPIKNLENSFHDVSTKYFIISQPLDNENIYQLKLVKYFPENSEPAIFIYQK